MGTHKASPPPAEPHEEIPSLHKPPVLWALSIILGLTLAPAIADIYHVYCM